MDPFVKYHSKFTGVFPGRIHGNSRPGYRSPTLLLGHACLIADLERPFLFWRKLMLTLQIQSVMSWGAWLLLVFSIISVACFYFWLPERFDPVDLLKKFRKRGKETVKPSLLDRLQGSNFKNVKGGKRYFFSSSPLYLAWKLRRCRPAHRGRTLHVHVPGAGGGPGDSHPHGTGSLRSAPPFYKKASMQGHNPWISGVITIAVLIGAYTLRHPVVYAGQEPVPATPGPPA